MSLGSEFSPNVSPYTLRPLLTQLKAPGKVQGAAGGFLHSVLHSAVACAHEEVRAGWVWCVQLGSACAGCMGTRNRRDRHEQDARIPDL